MDSEHRLARHFVFLAIAAMQWSCVSSAGPDWYRQHVVADMSGTGEVTGRGMAQSKRLTLARNTAIARAKRMVAETLNCSTVSGRTVRSEIQGDRAFVLWAGRCAHMAAVPGQETLPPWIEEYRRGKSGPEGDMRVAAEVKKGELDDAEALELAVQTARAHIQSALACSMPVGRIVDRYETVEALYILYALRCDESSP